MSKAAYNSHEQTRGITPSSARLYLLTYARPILIADYRAAIFSNALDKKATGLWRYRTYSNRHETPMNMQRRERRIARFHRAETQIPEERILVILVTEEQYLAANIYIVGEGGTRSKMVTGAKVPAHPGVICIIADVRQRLTLHQGDTVSSHDCGGT